MEKFEEGEHEANWHVHAYDKRKAVEKATEKLLLDERKSLDNDEMLEIEVGQTFPLFNFFR